jgi:hypothetical protein
LSIIELWQNETGSGVPKAQPAYHGPPPPPEGTDEQPATEVTDANRVKLKLTVTITACSFMANYHPICGFHVMNRNLQWLPQRRVMLMNGMTNLC